MPMWFRKKKRDTEQKTPTYGEFLVLHELCSEDIQNENIEKLRQQPRPEELCGVEIPKDLNSLTYGQLDDIRGLAQDSDVAYQLCGIVMGQTLNLLDEDVNKVFGFVNFCASEIERINKIFASLHHDYSSEEVQAGVHNLNFGSFGVLDWYAKRMGIANQNEVRDIAWVRIFQCMKNDHEQQEFEKRLSDIYMGKNKLPKHKTK